MLRVIAVGSPVVETYRRDRTWSWNCRHGPRWSGPLPEVPEVPPKRFFGLEVRSRLGISAGLLLNSRWIELYSRLGFDLLTYKTVRSAYRPCYPLPNWVWVEEPAEGLDPRRDQVLRQSARRPRDAARVTSAVCFGMPSQEPAVWREDVRASKRCLARGQALIVSVVGTPRDGGGEESLAEDFSLCARWAAESGADFVEANFSCPNVCSPEGSVYHDAAATGRIARAIREAIPSTRFLVKCGHFERRRDLQSFYAALEGVADGVVLVNGIARRVVTAAGEPAFGAYERVGVLGHAIHGAAVDNVREAERWIRDFGASIGTVAVGGCTTEDDPAPFFDAGVRGVVFGGAPMFDPLLAVRAKRAHPEW